MNSKIFFILIIITIAQARDVSVSTSSQLKTALSNAKPGDVITMDDGTYTGQFEATKNGASSNRITLRGSSKAYLTSDYNSWALHVTGDYWTFTGFTVQKSNKGIFLEGANFCLLQNLTVKYINEEGVHFRQNSRNNTIMFSKIRDTGTGKPAFGEGVYIGTALSKWDEEGIDESHGNKVLFNFFGPNVAAEAIDIKEGTKYGLVEGNTFDGTGMKGENNADSWVDIKGSNYRIVNNIGKYSLTDGFQVILIFVC